MRWLLCAALALAAEDPCTKPANAIVAENCKQGVSSDIWDVNGAGCPGVRGFATQASVLPGETIEFKIKLSFGEALKRVDIFRLGYYGGKGARVMGRATLDPHASSRTVTALCREGVAYSCAKWPVAASWSVDGPSGLYVARFVLADQTKGWRADASPIVSDNHHAVEGRDASLPPEKLAHAYGAGGKNRPREEFRLKEPRASHAYFVVRSSEKHDLLFQTADLTWHAYNGYGGLTTYGSFHYPYLHVSARALRRRVPQPERPEARPQAGARAKLRHAVDHARLPVGERAPRAGARRDPISRKDGLRRPLRDGLRPLREARGQYPEAVAGLLIRGPRRVLDARRPRPTFHAIDATDLTTHRYGQRDAIERARRRGVHLNFWSANEAYWAVRFEGRTMICYKETQNIKKMDRHDVWTGTFRDSRPINPRGARPENALSGHMFVANAQRVDALFVDGERFGRHRAWRNTSVAQGHSYHTPKGVLGHEWDEVVDNGWSPPYLQRLSQTTVDNVQCLRDVGAVFDSCSATHNLVLSRHEESKAWTFGSGTVQWAWALDDVHDANDPQRQNKYSIRVEKDTAGVVRDLQQLTVNVFRMQGVLPATLDESLVLVDESDDLEAPTASLLYANLEDGVLRLSGSASDVGGVVASVEVSWSHGRWHLADLDRLASEVTWSLAWGHEEWHALHGELPGGDYPFELRVSDDSGNMRTIRGPGDRGGGEL